MDSLEIYYCDLNPDMQQKVLRLYGLDNPADGNFDILPLRVLDVERDSFMLDDEETDKLLADSFMLDDEESIDEY